MDSYKDMIVWQRAVQMSLAIYKATATFPKEETYGLRSQMRRASVSVASNIAEGYVRTTTGEYKQFLGIARGSNAEIQTQIIIARGLGFGDAELLDAAESLSNEVGKILPSVIRGIEEWQKNAAKAPNADLRTPGERLNPNA